ncbi:hypothetical protein CRU98_04570 [Arcobacter sp. CECT 8986]|nr:hypothetical protein CRU98_04570 [Arcobacter sp. CECT 8986]
MKLFIDLFYKMILLISFKKRISKLRSNDYILLYKTKVMSNLDDFISRRMKPILDKLFLIN